MPRFSSTEDPVVVRRGDGIRLQRVRWVDRSTFLAVTRASRDLHRPWVFPPTTEVTYRRWIGELATGRHERLLLWRNADEALLAYFGLNGIFRGAYLGAFLGYWVNAEHAGEGYMTMGLKLVLDHAFRRLRLHRIEANIQPDNRCSIALVRRVGFRKEGFSPRYLKIAGHWRDHERWAITAEEWPPCAKTRAPPG